MKKRIIISGHGGQGVVLAGSLIANAAMDEGLEVCGMVSYGAEMRGGSAHSAVTISDKKIASPVIDTADIVITLNKESYLKYSGCVEKGGTLLVNSSVVKPDVNNDITIIEVPSTDLAKELGNIKVVNIISIGAAVKATGIIELTDVKKALQKAFARKPELITINEKALEKGAEYV